MSKSRIDTPSPKSDLAAMIEGFRVRCREAGLKVTPQRVGIYEVLVRSQDHPSVEQLHRAVRGRFPNISLDTVNRALHTINEMGLAHTVEGTGDARRYDGVLEDHQHFKCLRCRKVVDIFDVPNGDIPTPLNLEGFSILRKSIYFEGICDRCKQSTTGENSEVLSRG
jgi:Fur family peroxide stress response transcriptional regulator